jgi:exoribonuclease II
MGEHSLQEAINQFLKGSKIRGSIQAMQIEEVWEHLMGKTIARYTDKIQLFGNKLIITTHVAPLKQELNFQKEKIKQRVNETLKENIVTEVIIQ